MRKGWRTASRRRRDVPVPAAAPLGEPAVQELDGAVAAPPADPQAPPSIGKPASGRAAAKQIRGSSILLVGRVLSMASNFAATVLIVRYLSKADYGAFAYALSLVALGETIVTFGLDRAVTRFIPIYEERGEYGKLLGTLVMVTGAILGLGATLYVLLLAFQGSVFGALIDDRQAVSLLLILLLLSPLQAYDGLLIGMFSVFSRPGAIFFRRHVLAPGLKIAVVLLLILGNAGVTFLAVGYVAAALIGVALYTVMLVRLLRQRGLLRQMASQRLSLPIREVLSFTVPLLSSDLVYAVMNTSNAVLLGWYGGTTEVAAFRAVQPAARMNQVVFSSFTLLFTPLAARLFARGDREGINELYWQTAIWMAVFSFPIFALTFSLAQPLTVTLYGQRYDDSAAYLALMSLGYYFNAALGHNGLTLKVFGILRYIVTLNVAAALLNLGLNFVLIPRYGALGAAIGTCGTLIAHNLFKQYGLLMGTGINLFESRYLRVYLAIVVSAASLWAVQAVWGPDDVVKTVLLAAVASIAVFRLGRSQLHIADTFPELLRLPFARKLFG